MPVPPFPKKPISLPFVLFALGVCTLAAVAVLPIVPSADLKVYTTTGTHDFDVEIAATPSEQAKGLMHRTALGDDEGMLFVYPAPVDTAFWMKNTLIPLDMIFIDEYGKIVRITANTRPLTLTPRPSPSPVVGVLEINGGRASELGMQIGDIITHEALPD